MATLGPVVEKGSVQESLRKQLQEEIGGATLKNPERFALEQKYGLTDPVLTSSELAMIATEGQNAGN